MQKLNQNITILTLKSFDKKDKEEIVQLINAKYFKLDKKNLYFLKQLYKFNLEKIDSAVVIKKLSNSENYTWSSQVIREALSKLNTLFKDFIYLKESQRHKFNPVVVLSEYYTKHNILQHPSTLKNFLNKQKDSISLEANFEAYLLFQKLVVSDKKLKGRKLSDNLEKAHLHLNYAYWVEMLKLECEIQNRKDKVKLFDMPSLLHENEKTLEFIQEHLWENQLIRLYFLLYHLKTDKDFSLVYREWESSLSKISKEDAKSISIYLLNYSIDKITKGSHEFAQTYLTIIDVLIEYDLLLEHDVMIDSSYNNIISIALKEQELEWADSFINRYSKFLLDGERSNTFKLCKSKVLFAKNKFESAYDILSKINFQKDYYFNISTNILLIRCSVELKMDDIALNKISNLELAISRAEERFSKSTFTKKCLRFLEVLKLILKNKKVNPAFDQKMFEEDWLKALIKKRK